MNGGEPHDTPTAAELVEAVREFLADQVMATTTGRVQFHVRIAINVLAMVERELSLGEEQAKRHRQRLADLGYANEAALAGAIRSGLDDERLAELAGFVRTTVRDKLTVANPRYLKPPSPA